MPDAYVVGAEIQPQCRTERLEDRIAGIVERQHGVIARRQLIGCGLGAGAIAHRLKTRRLHAVHRGVYAIGHRALTREGRWMAAVLAAGKTAALSHRTAAAIWEMMRSELLEVTSPAQRRPRRGFRLHCSTLPSDEITTVRGIPVTTVPRTLLDLAAVLPRDKLERAFHEAEENLLTDPLSLPVLLGRYPGREGTPAIRELLEKGAELTRSELEARFRAFIAEFALPRPELNAWLQIQGEWLECDCLWRRQRLIAELDGRSFHDTGATFERDRARDRRLSAAGWRVIRVTWRQLQQGASEVAADLRIILHRSSL